MHFSDLQQLQHLQHTQHALHIHKADWSDKGNILDSLGTSWCGLVSAAAGTCQGVANVTALQDLMLRIPNLAAFAASLLDRNVVCVPADRQHCGRWRRCQPWSGWRCRRWALPSDRPLQRWALCTWDVGAVLRHRSVCLHLSLQFLMSQQRHLHVWNRHHHQCVHHRRCVTNVNSLAQCVRANLLRGRRRGCLLLRDGGQTGYHFMKFPGGLGKRIGSAAAHG